jgi:transcriptional regulator with XRE-family HTH domain
MEKDFAFKELLIDIGDKFYQLRHLRKEKITAVASSIGISHPVISQIENGNYKSLSIELLFRLANYYNVSVQDILIK